MDKLVKAARDLKRANHSIEMYSKGMIPYNISDETYESMDEIERQLNLARIDAGIIITNKK